MTTQTCADCGYTLYVFADGSMICSLCYVHGTKKAKKIAKARVAA